ncbi:molybdopterin-guanine dinucleotide biosynthesis protein B [Metabacillus malikii]|uniref:Molybdopterin-guanine dinucleotide biosynthesis protein B n=1 Tax=Metabacillus malikii TaxID=1504265 RepID=A0ABT9ZC97_9BACI|nr:molybdopterin-guanine dinucleotide biosynthesis protein B [Metabacillus malikii]MDQ0229549.1 molybdopterin-guanine dinucleotide biosynthesis protein B [Metabacillus malikii]
MGRILQVVGYKNSGKTTFVSNYIKQMKQLNLKVGTIKHHGHGKLTPHDDETDTGKHRQAGALVSVVEGNGSIMLNTDALSLSLPQLITIYSHFNLDYIIVEGYKDAQYEKVVLLHSNDDLFLLDTLHRIYCVVSRVELPIEITKKFRVFYDDKKCIEWLIENQVGDKIE